MRQVDLPQASRLPVSIGFCRVGVVEEMVTGAPPHTPPRVMSLLPPPPRTHRDTAIEIDCFGGNMAHDSWPAPVYHIQLFHHRRSLYRAV